MTVSALIRWGALSAILGGVLWVISDPLDVLVGGLVLGSEPFSAEAATGSFVVSVGLYLLGTVLVLFGLVGLNLHQSEAAGGVLGGLGFLAAFLGTALVVGTFWSLLFVAAPVAVEAPAVLDSDLVLGTLGVGFLFSFLVMAVGWALFGVAALRARSWPRWVAILLIIGALLYPLLASFINGAGLVLDVAVALLGYFTLVGGRRSAEQPSGVS